MPVRRASISFLVATALLSTIPAITAQKDTARIYVTVIDHDKPVKGLSVKDFTVKEDSTIKTVVSAEPATKPMSVVLLTDRFGLDNTYNVFDVRGALSTVVETLHKGSPDTEIGFITFDGAAVPVVKPTTSTAALLAAFKGLITNGNSPVLLEAIFNASVALERVPTDRRIVFVLMAGYKPDMSSTRAPDVINEMQRAGVSLWTLEGRSVFSANPQGIDRQAVTDLAGKASGGVHEQVGQGTALERQAKYLAELLLSQYAVEYAAPAAHAKGLEVGVSVKGAKVIAPNWPR
jgi:hypothetical protein